MRGHTTWRDVIVVCRNVAPGTPLARAIDPHHGAWSMEQAMLAELVDAAVLRLWQAGGKGEKPKPLPRPWPVDGADQTNRYKGTPLTVEQADALAARFRPREVTDGN